MEQTPNTSINPFTLSQSDWVMCSAYCLTMRNIGMQFNETSSNGLGDMERTQNCRRNHMTLTLSLCSRVIVIGSAHYLIKRII